MAVKRILHEAALGATPLYIACQNKHAEVVAALLAHGANVNQARTGRRHAGPIKILPVSGANSHLGPLSVDADFMAYDTEDEVKSMIPMHDAGAINHLNMASERALPVVPHSPRRAGTMEIRVKDMGEQKPVSKAVGSDWHRPTSIDPDSFTWFKPFEDKTSGAPHCGAGAASGSTL